MNPSHMQENIFLPLEVQEREGYALSREQKAEAQRYGTVVHALLERQTTRKWADFMQDLPALLRQLAPDMEIEKRQQIEEEMAAVASYPDLLCLLEQPAYAEVPVIGRNAAGAAIAGRIDRLIVSDSHVHIIDFKTGTVTADAAQLHAYAEVVGAIYPEHILELSYLYTRPIPSLQTL